MSSSTFHFKSCSIDQEGAAHPVGTDGVLLGAWADTRNATTILDIGTGTGLIALMLAQRSSSFVKIRAIDINPGSVACAAKNFSNSPWAERLKAQETSLQAFAAKSTERFDLIVSNPPFFPERTLSPDQERSMARHSGTLSLADLLDCVNSLLLPDGKCCFILPEKEGKRLCEMSVPLGLFCTREVQVRSKVGKPVERLLLQLEREPGRFSREKLEIYEVSGGYTAAYRSLTSDFYLDKQDNASKV